MDKNESNELLQNFRSMQGVLRQINMDKINLWNEPHWENILSKPATISGYGITDCYTKAEVDDNFLKLEDGELNQNLWLNSAGSVKGVFFSGNGASYSSIVGSDTFLALDVQNKASLGIADKITLTSQGTSGGVVLYNATKLLGGVETNYKELLQYDSSTNRIILGDYFIPTQVRKGLELPKLDIYNSSDVLEGSIEADIYSVNDVIHDGFRIVHKSGKYSLWGYENANGGINSYMILDFDEVLRNPSDGDDWAPIRFEKQALFRNGLRIGSTADIIIGGYNLKTKIASIENAIETGTGMVQWSNVLNKPSTLNGYGITDALSLTGGTLTGDLKIQKDKKIYSFEGNTNYNLIELNADGQIKVGDYNKIIAFRSLQHFILANANVSTHFTCISPSITSGESLFGSKMQNGSDFSSYLRVGSSSLQYNNGVNDYNVFHEGNMQKALPPSNSSTVSTNLIIPKLEYTAPIVSATAGIFPTVNNANSILNVGMYVRELACYQGQLGFSSNARLYYRHYNSQDPSNNPTKPWNTIAFTSDSSNGLQSKTSNYSNGTDKNKWTKIASISVSYRYGHSDVCLAIQSLNEITNSVAFGLIVAKIKQQNAMGGVPNVAISMPVAKNISTSDIVGVITENTTSNSKLDIYVKYIYDWMNYSITKISGYGSFDTYDTQSNISTLPSGTQVAIS